jgi:hypothetical protein
VVAQGTQGVTLCSLARMSGYVHSGASQYTKAFHVQFLLFPENDPLGDLTA